MQELIELVNTDADDYGKFSEKSSRTNRFYNKLYYDLTRSAITAIFNRLYPDDEAMDAAGLSPDLREVVARCRLASADPQIFILSPKAVLYTKHEIAVAYLKSPFDLRPYASAYRLWMRCQRVATERAFYALEREGELWLRKFELDTLIWLAIRASRENLVKKCDPDTKREAACRDQLFALSRRKMAWKESAAEKGPIILKVLCEAIYAVIVEGGALLDFTGREHELLERINSVQDFCDDIFRIIPQWQSGAVTEINFEQKPHSDAEKWMRKALQWDSGVAMTPDMIQVARLLKLRLLEQERSQNISLLPTQELSVANAKALLQHHLIELYYGAHQRKVQLLSAFNFVLNLPEEIHDQLSAACRVFHWSSDWIDPLQGKLLSRSLIWIMDYINLTLKYACADENLRRGLSKRIKAFSASPFQDFLSYAGSPPQFQFKDPENNLALKEICVVQVASQQAVSRFGVFSGKRTEVINPAAKACVRSRASTEPVDSNTTQIIAEVYNSLIQIQAELKELYPHSDNIVESIKNARAETTAKHKNLT